MACLSKLCIKITTMMLASYHNSSSIACYELSQSNLSGDLRDFSSTGKRVYPGTEIVIKVNVQSYTVNTHTSRKHGGRHRDLERSLTESETP
jgi:hypothetical protein